MGRGKKKLYEEKIDKRETGYYSTPDFVSEYIGKRMLEINPNGKRVLDPCCGKEELLGVFLNSSKEVDSFDIITFDHKYRSNFKELDFIKFYSERKINSRDDKDNKVQLNYDYYIANPPYNCHEVHYIRDNKEELKRVFDDVGVYNMYSMFISAIIDCAKKGSVIGLITHDSFFTAKYHEKLRKKILSTCAIHEITMCPTDLFINQGADVRTSIIIMQRGVEYQGLITVNNRVESKNLLRKMLNRKLHEEIDSKDNNPLNQGNLTNTLSNNKVIDFKTSEKYSNLGGERNNLNNDLKKYRINEILLNDDIDYCEFIIECPFDIRVLFNNERIKDRFRCVTGISTGRDELYLSNKKIYPYTIPFYKNPGKNRFYADNYIFLHRDFLKLNRDVDNFIVRNRDLLFKPGITCSSMGVEFTAARLPEGCTFGVNANIICSDYDAWYLMAYLNSNLVTYMVRGILNRSNMITSGYVSRIPLINFSKDDMAYLVELSKEAYELAKNKRNYDEILNKINNIVNKAANISAETINIINKFKINLIKNT